MPPQFVSLGPFTLNTYTFLIALAALASLAWAWFYARDAGIFAVALLLAFGALVGGRAVYVALHWDYFHEHAHEIVSLAGLSEHGAILGGAIACYASRITHRPSPAQLSIFNSQFSILNSQFFILLAIAASIGCIPNGCAYGREVFWQTDGADSLAWWLRADWPDAYLVNNPRWPTQAFMALWLAITGALMWAGACLRRAPLAFLPLLIVSFAIGDFLIQFLRGDSALMVAGLRIYQWFDLALALLAAVAIILRRKIR